MKFFLGVGDVGSILNEWAEGFRANGMIAKTAVHSKSIFFPQNTYDYDLAKIDKKLFGKAAPLGGYSKKQILAKGVNLGSRFIQNLQLISSFDAFLFVTPSLSVFKPELDFKLIKSLNKKLIIVCVGTDIRHHSGFMQEFPTSEALLDDQFLNDPIERALGNLRRAEKYADIIYSLPDQSSMAIRKYMHWQIPVKVEDYIFDIPDRDVPIVVHAPSRRGIKGTTEILAALDQLKSEGFEFELRLLEKVSNKVIRENLSQADLLVDELVLNGPGILSLEAMSSGCAVATKYLENSPDFFRPPVCAIDEHTVYQKLKLLLSSRQLRKEMAEKGRLYVEKNNDKTIVTKKILNDLNSLAYGTLNYDYQPDFFKKHYRLPKNIKLPAYLLSANRQLAEHYWEDFQEWKSSLEQRNLI